MSKQLTRNILALLFALVMIGLPIWDKLSPMQDYAKTIESRYGAQFAWCVGLSYVSNAHGTSVTRAYILIPDCFSNPRVVIVSNVNNTQPSVFESTFTFFAVIFVYGSLAWGVVRSLWPRRGHSGDGSQSDIKSL